MPTAVSDSSTLIHLAVLGRLGLLREFYDQVLIPPAYPILIQQRRRITEQ